MASTREQVRDLIADRLAGGMDLQSARQIADSVMELFPDVVTEYVRLRPGWVLPATDLDGDHYRFVLRTEPEPVSRD